MRVLRLNVLLLPLFFTAFSARLVSCDCIGPSQLCEAAFRADVVFSGRVLNISKDKTYGLFFERRVRFQVENNWRGGPAREITLYTGVGNGDCGFPFEKGKRYLVYATRAIDILATGLCTGTKELRGAEKDLEYLRTLSEPSAGGRIFGRYLHQRHTPNEIISEPIPNSAVVLKRDGGPQQTVTTDVTGNYEITGLSPGTYRFLPPAYKWLGEPDIRIPDPHACAQADIIFVPPTPLPR